MNIVTSYSSQGIKLKVGVHRHNRQVFPLGFNPRTHFKGKENPPHSYPLTTTPHSSSIYRYTYSNFKNEIGKK